MVPARTPPPSRARRWVPLVALAYLVLHLPFLAPSLEDIDSINFALGLHRYDLVQHQPHPPGYPVYIALGRMMLRAVSLVPGVTPTRADALALALWSAIGGAVAIAGAARLFRAVEQRFGNGEAGPWPVLLLAAAPLFWMCGLRPMSDMPGLAAVLWSQALLVEGADGGWALLAGALLTGIGAGIRIQTLALTAPALAFAMASAWWHVSWRETVRAAAAALAGVLVWAIPLLRLTGGPAGYLEALHTQAGEDFAWVDMLWSDPTPRRLGLNLYDTFVLPWESVRLAQFVTVAGVLGVVASWLKTPRALAAMLLLFVPYTVYHLLFQETITVRYALPVLPLIVWLASRISLFDRRVAAIVGALAVASLIEAIPGAVLYGREAHPAYRAIEEATRKSTATRPARVFAHFGLRRSLQHGAGSLPFVEPRREYEWLGPFDYWRSGGTGEVWFFADSMRTDLALIDPASRRRVTRYEWAAGERAELRGTRPLGVEWYRLSRPGWFVGQGWSLTPEAGGLTHATATGPEHRPIEGWILHRREGTQVMIGGRYLGQPGEPDTELRLYADGLLLDTWVASAREAAFLRFVSLPPSGSSSSTYATLRIESRAVNGGRNPEVAIRQFDAQPASGVVFGFGDGWYEPEYTPENGDRWRWTSERSVVQLRGTAQPLTLTLRGESPLKYFDGETPPASLDRPPVVRVTSGSRTLYQFTPANEFETQVALPSDIWRDGAAAVAIEVDRIYLPGPVEGTNDQRHLGLRLFDIRIDTALR